MSIKSIQTKKKVRYLFDVNFDGDDAHIAYTDGAASLKDEPYLLKQQNLELTEEQKLLLKELNPSSEATAGEELTQEKGNEDTMSVENLQKQLDAQEAVTKALLQELAVERTSKATDKYAFDAEVGESVVKTLAALDDASRKVMLSAFDVLVGRTEAAVTKALGDVKATEENPLKKALDKEEGHSEKTVVVEETLVQKAMKAQDEKLNKEAK